MYDLKYLPLFYFVITVLTAIIFYTQPKYTLPTLCPPLTSFLGNVQMLLFTSLTGLGCIFLSLLLSSSEQHCFAGEAEQVEKLERCSLPCFSYPLLCFGINSSAAVGLWTSTLISSPHVILQYSIHAPWMMSSTSDLLHMHLHVH